MSKLLLIGIGGFAGAICRYLVSEFLLPLSKQWGFPVGTLTANLLGCFLIGLLAQLALTYAPLDVEHRPLIFIGFLGAFTTFSTFGFETIILFQNGQNLTALSYIVISITLGLLTLLLGQKAANLFG